MNKIYATALLMSALLTAPEALAQSQTVFAYAPADSPMMGTGTSRKENYDVAIALTNPALYGMEITSISIPVVPSANVSNLSAWVAKELKLETVDGSKKNVTDASWQLEMPTEGDPQFVTLGLDSPYTIPDGGLYVGYSLDVNMLDQTNATLNPIVVTQGVNPGSLYMHTSRSYRNWADRSQSMNATSMVQVTIQGNIPINGVKISSFDSKFVQVGDAATVTAMVYNVGLTPVQSLTYTATMGDAAAMTEVLTLDDPIPATFGYGQKVTFTLPPVDAPGQYEATVNVTGVNGADNGIDLAMASAEMTVVARVPKHCALVEEYTGTWCGWCPRGFAAMEATAQLIPDFVGIAYHNSDPMAMLDGDPGMVSGYPNAYIDRVSEIDPYYANGGNAFSLPQVYERYSEPFVPVAIELEAEIDDNNVVTATSRLSWTEDMDDPDRYRIEYVLVADDLHGNGGSWNQENNYSSYPPGSMEYMDLFCGASSIVRGLHYNDVAIMTSGFKGVEGSVPSISMSETTEHTYTFNTNQALNVYNQLIPFDREHLRVVAFVLKTNSRMGTVINATKCHVQVGAGINAISDPATVKSVEYHDLQGRCVAAPSRGVYVRTIRYTDGTVTNTKVAIR